MPSSPGSPSTTASSDATTDRASDRFDVVILPIDDADLVAPMSWPLSTEALSTGPWADVARTGLSLQLTTLAELDESVVDELAAAGFDRVACRPVWGDHGLLAVAVALCAADGAPRTDLDAELTAQLGRSIVDFAVAHGVALLDAAPNALDPLTGVASSGGLQDEIDGGDGDAVVLYVDLDGLDHVNETYGNDAGDSVLIESARRLERTVRSRDRVFRMTGDEFVVVIRGAEQLDSIQTAARIIDELALPYGVTGADGIDELVSVTAGVGMCVPSEGTPFDSAVFAALHALGEAKLAGRDRLHIVGR